MAIVRATMQVNGEAQNLTPYHAETPYAGVIKIIRGDYVVDPYTCAKQKFVTIRPGVSFPRMRDFARQIAHQKVLAKTTSGGARTSRQPGHFQVSTVVGR